MLPASHCFYYCMNDTMAPTSTVRNKLAASKFDKGKGSTKSITSSSGIRKTKSSKGPKLPPPKQQKTKPTTKPPKKKKRVYTEKELGLPKLNRITPVGVDRPKGKKKGKIFVDDQVLLLASPALQLNSDLRCRTGKHDDHSGHCECE